MTNKSTAGTAPRQEPQQEPEETFLLLRAELASASQLQEYFRKGEIFYSNFPLSTEEEFGQFSPEERELTRTRIGGDLLFNLHRAESDVGGVAKNVMFMRKK
jgi:hypothetical protein